MDFVDNVIERASGTIRGRALLANPNGVFTPGMFGRVRVPGSPPYEALLVPDAAIGSEQVRKFVLVVDDENTARIKYVTLGQLGRRSARHQGRASRPDDRVIVNGLMRARPGAKVTPQEQGAAASRRRSAGEDELRVAMKISHFFIDRPIFASVLSIVFIILGGVSFIRLPIAQYPEIAPPIINVSGQYPGANAEVVATTVVAPIEEQINGVENMLYMSSNATADGRFSIAVTFEIGTNLDIAQVQVQNRVGIAQPRLPVRRAQDRRDGHEVLARPDDGRASVFARPVARLPVHLELRDARDQGRAHARRRRRLDHGVRQPRLCDADLARSGPAAIARHDGDRRDAGAAGAEHPGRLRRAEPAAGRQAGRVPGRRADARAARQSGGIRQHRGEADRRRGGAAEGCRAGPACRAGLFVEFLSRPQPGGRARDLPAARLERARDRRRHRQDDGRALEALPGRHRSTPSSTIRPSSSASRSTP